MVFQGEPLVGEQLILQVQRPDVEPVALIRMLSDQLIAPQSVPCGVILPGIGELYVDLGPGVNIQSQGLLTDTVGTLPLAIPDKVSLIGLDFVAQYAIVDVSPSSPGQRIELTNGLLVTIGG